MAGEDTTSSSKDMILVEAPSTQRSAEPEESQALIPFQGEGSIAPLHLTGVLEDISQIKGGAAMLLLSSHTKRIETDLQATKKELSAAKESSEKWMANYYNEKESSAILRTQLQAVSSKKNLQTFIGTIGGIIVGVAIPFLIEGEKGWALAASLIGCSLLVAGFWPSEFKETKK